MGLNVPLGHPKLGFSNDGKGGSDKERLCRTIADFRLSLYLERPSHTTFRGKKMSVLMFFFHPKTTFENSSDH